MSVGSVVSSVLLRLLYIGSSVGSVVSSVLLRLLYIGNSVGSVVSSVLSRLIAALLLNEPQWSLGSFDYNYQNVFRCNLCYGD